MKYLISSLTALFISISLLAQKPLPDSVAQANVQAEATTMLHLFMGRDYIGFSAFTYPPILKMAGGKDKMAEAIKKSMDGMEDQGFKISNIEIRDCSPIIHTGKQLQCTLVQVLEIKAPNGTMTRKSALIGISEDNGTKWTFLDTHGAPLKDLQQKFKELSSKLVITAISSN